MKLPAARIAAAASSATATPEQAVYKPLMRSNTRERCAALAKIEPQRPQTSFQEFIQGEV